MEAPATRASTAAAAPKTVRVLALIDHLELGGAQMLVSHFAAAAPEAGIDVSVACLRERRGNLVAAPLVAAGVVPVNLEIAPGRPGIAAIRAVERLIDDVRPDVVHTHLGTADVVGGIAAKRRGIPCVSSLHTMDWDRSAGTYAKRLVVRACAARIVAVSDAAAADYRRRPGWCKRGQLVTINNGVDVTATPGAGAAVRRELGIGGGELVVGMISALRPEKCHDLAIAAVRTLLGRLTSLRLVIVGEGAEADGIARLAADLGDRVVMTGHRTDVMACLDAFDVLLHPSRIEAFPTTVIEAMAASTPVVATAVGGVPEIITDGDTGVLVPAPASSTAIAGALELVLADQPLRAALGVAGRRAYEHRFTAGPWVRRTRALYEELGSR